MLFVAATGVVFFQLTVAKNDVDQIVDQSALSDDMAQIALLIERKDSYVSSYLLLNSNLVIENYRSVSEDLNELFEQVAPYFESKKSEIEFSRVIANSSDIDDIFLNTIINPDIERSDRISAQIHVDTKKTSSVALINRLIDSVTEEQSEAVTRTNGSLTKSFITLVIANIVAIVIGVIIMILISRAITTNLRKVVET